MVTYIQDGVRVDPYGRPVTPEKPDKPAEAPEGTNAPREAAKAGTGKQARPTKARKGKADAAE